MQQQVLEHQRKLLFSIYTFRSTEPEQDPKEKYAAQLVQMKDMGFIDETTNLEVLKQ